MKKVRSQKMINKLAKASFKEGRLIESSVVRSIKLLKMQPESQAVPSLLEYLKNLKMLQRRYTLYIETVTPLSTNQLNKIKKIVEKKIYGEQSRTTKITKIVTRINPEILGGLKLQVGDEVWDESVLAKLNQVKEVIIYGRHN